MKEKIRHIVAEAQNIGWIMEPQAKEILRLYRIPVPESVWARTESVARQAADKLGFPLAAKVVSPDIVHKSDSGGVVVDIRDADQAAGAFLKMSGLKGFQGIFLERMAFGTELIVGSKNDPQYGTVIMVGIGGVSVEVYSDVAIRTAPLSAAAALTAVQSLKGKALLQGHRGKQPADMKKIAGLLAAFSEMAVDLSGEVESIDLNPVFCSESGAVAADARMILVEKNRSRPR